MSRDQYTRFHQAWLGMAQPSEGLVFSVPVLVEAQVMNRRDRAARRATLRDLLDEGGRLNDLRGLLCDLLGHKWGRSADDSPPEGLCVTVAEGGQTLRPTHRLFSKKHSLTIPIWRLPGGLSMDAKEEETGPWRYPPSGKMARLLWGSGAPLGLLVNDHAARLFYAPKGASLGWVEFRFADMADAGGGPLLDAFTSLLTPKRALGRGEGSLLKLVEESRNRQADITDDLAAQVLEALSALLEGFDRANALDPRRPLDEALREGGVYNGLLTVVLRLIFLLYAEAHALLPVEHPIYQRAYSVLGLYDRLVDDEGRHPDEMGQRFGAWAQLLATFRALYHGGVFGGEPPLTLPPRAGELFHPDAHPWLEGRGLNEAHSRLHQGASLPRVDDGAVLTVLDKLLTLKGQRLSYKALGVEELGGVYERLMGFSVQRLVSPARKLRGSGAWITAPEVLEVPQGQRGKWLRDEYALSGPQSRAAAKALKGLVDEAAILEALSPFAARGEPKPAEALILQPGPERRRTSSHYTPRSLSGPVVARALEPVLRSLGEAPTPEQILSLSVCDPAMGSGAFLVESCRALGVELERAWARAGMVVEEPEVQARRLVARRCLYGVDKNRLAVGLARLSLWLVTFSRDLPFTFLDHALRYGDSLVGLTTEQIRMVHWKTVRRGKAGPLFDDIEVTLASVRDHRAVIRSLEEDNAKATQAQKEADRELLELRVAGDLTVAAFFAEAKDPKREGRRLIYREKVDAFKAGRREGLEALAIQRALREEQGLPPFHWEIEFPEVFARGGFDVIVGNPPFLGGKRISTMFGDAYRDWIATLHEGASKNADLSAHFFRRADALLKPSGAYGLIATNTIAQGDTRETGLGWLLSPLRPKQTRRLYDAVESMPWPGNAAVTVSIAHIARGEAARLVGEVRLGGEVVEAINSRLNPKPERAPTVSLKANDGLTYVGAYVLGAGFTLTPEEREVLVARDPRNEVLIHPYLGGREINSDPAQSFERYVISFGQMSLEEAAAWPDLLEIVETKVKPERDKVKRKAHRERWWHYADKRPALFAALEPLERCLVCSRHTKHLAFAWQPADRVFSEATYVFPREDDALFSVLQSRVHEPWAWLHSSQMKTDLRYSPTDCLANFAFPRGADMTAEPLNRAGADLYAARARFMIDHGLGLTKTYNRLKDPEDRAPEIEALRRLHEAMDEAVLRAYGWEDLIPSLPPYGTPSQAFEDEVIDRLFALNAERAAAEAEAEAAAKPAPKPKKRRKPKPQKAPVDNPQGELF